MQLNKLAATLAAVGLAAPGLVVATNGMIMEGYGPIAAGMGGASMAYDNGSAAMANNPATLGLMSDGSRIDVMVGQLHVRQHAAVDYPPEAQLVEKNDRSL